MDSNPTTSGDITRLSPPFIKKNQLNYLNLRFINKSDNLVIFINKEISKAYENEPFLRINHEQNENVIVSIEEYIQSRKEEVPIVGMEDTKRLIVLLSLIEKEIKDIKNIYNIIKLNEMGSLLNIKSFLIFVVYFLIELFIGLISLYSIYINYEYSGTLSKITIILSIISIAPLSYLIYDLQYRNS
jgi:hypothetical protein